MLRIFSIVYSARTENAPAPVPCLSRQRVTYRVLTLPARGTVPRPVWLFRDQTQASLMHYDSLCWCQGQD